MCRLGIHGHPTPSDALTVYIMFVSAVSTSRFSVMSTSTLLMWPFSGPRNPYHETIAAKRARRDEAIKLAPPFMSEEHQKYLNATGNYTVPRLALMLLLAVCLGLSTQR